MFTHHRDLPHAYRGLFVLMTLALLVPVAGCSDDDGPTNPGGDNNGTPTEFDQTMAVTQAQTAAPQGIALVESMAAMATGFVAKDSHYAWNEANQRWEYTWNWSQEGYTYDWFYAVQYLDGGGTPQQDVANAVSARHIMNGTGDYSYSQDGTAIDYSYTYAYDTTLSGLQTDTLVLNGSGGIDIDYTYSGRGMDESATYALDWETLGNGITMPVDGCPSGTIRYDMDPYYLDLVFDGSGNVQGTLYDGGGNEIPSGSTSDTLACVR